MDRTRMVRGTLLLAALALATLVVLYALPGASSREPAVSAPSATAASLPTPAPTPGNETAPLIFELMTRTLRPIGGPRARLFQPFPLADGTLLIVDETARRWQIIALDGTVVQSLPLPFPDIYPVPSPDGRLLAYSRDGIVRVYDRDSGAERTLNERAEASPGHVAWSPDGTEFAVAFREGQTAGLDVIDLTTGSVTHAYSSGATLADVEIVGWSGPHEVDFRLYEGADLPADVRLRGDVPLANCCPVQGGARYTVSDRGGDLTQTGDQNALWRLCGPACGLPPPGYEAADGSVEWCLPTESSCAVGIVDRAAGVIRQLPDEGQLQDYAVSPDRSLVALTLRDRRNRQRLRIVNVRDFTWQDYDLPYVYEGHGIRWFPDSRALVLYFWGN